MIGRARLSLEPLETRETPAATGRVVLDCEGFVYMSRASGDPDRPVVLGTVPNPSDVTVKGAKVLQNAPAPNSNETITIDANRTETVYIPSPVFIDGSVR